MKNLIPIAVTIPALANGVAGVFTQPTNGKIFTCLSASAAFKIRADSGDLFAMTVGRDFGNSDAPEFGRLGFYNESASPIIVTGIVSDEPYQTAEVVVTSAVSVTSSNKDADSYTKGRGTPTLLDTTSVSFNGLDGANKRKQFAVRNRDTSPVGALLQIKDSAGTIMDILNPGDPPWSMPTNGTFIITASGGDVNYLVSETFNL